MVLPEQADGSAEGRLMADVKPPLIALTEHPRAAYAIRRWKASAGLAGFAGGGRLAAGGTACRCPTRCCAALIGGVAGYFVGGFAAVTVWRNMLQSEARIAVAARPGAAAARAGAAAER